MALVRTHMLREVPKWDYQEAFAFCGKRGFKARGGNSEYETDIGDRWEIATDGYKPTCKRCLAHYTVAPPRVPV